MTGKHRKATESKIQKIRRYWKSDDAPTTSAKCITKFRNHVIFITVGIALSIAASYITTGLVAHLMFGLPVATNYGMEIVDRIRSL